MFAESSYCYSPQNWGEWLFLFAVPTCGYGSSLRVSWNNRGIATGCDIPSRVHFIYKGGEIKNVRDRRTI